MKHNIKVSNVSCMGCVNSIESELKKLDKITSVSVNKDTGYVEVEGAIERDEITRVLNQLGYPEA